MIALDTNALVRFIVEDDDVQAAQVAALVDRIIESGERLFVSDIALCETVWVLTRSYRFPREQVANGLHILLRAAHLTFARPDAIAQAVDAFQQRRGDFADYLIREHARAAGCDAVVTFDRALLREPGFVAPA